MTGSGDNSSSAEARTRIEIPEPVLVSVPLPPWILRHFLQFEDPTAEILKVLRDHCSEQPTEHEEAFFSTYDPPHLSPPKPGKKSHRQAAHHGSRSGASSRLLKRASRVEAA